MKWPPLADWPMADLSERIIHKPHRWHVQSGGKGPTVLLIHGAGGATQSWRALFPLLAQDHHVVAVDLPGQGFTQSGSPRRFGPAQTAADLCCLCEGQGWKPDLIIGHSAGVPIALEMVLNGMKPKHGVVGINGALATFDGMAGWLFPTMAKLLALTPFSAQMITATATPARVAKLLSGTGSQIDPEGHRLYFQLASDASHVQGVLSMMAQWSLEKLAARLAGVDVPVLLMTSDGDTVVPPDVSASAARRMPQAQVISLGLFGHLVHEEAPNVVLSALHDHLKM